ncbi:MAG: 2-dehydropantoate 2-reductase [Vicinamibacterales bacterium]|jgi:2-dehydropantoate 2-reductase|nr:2-dehydropantoate 2-reductase [Acidobacteriota bacterium]MDP7294325.1 2-dehydropantoate 2-reductase [Vicinamibacterales bacterium]MDP7471453.1 2-dehydropantoate 2-reductase [Vicinamibacterales bacterium]HJO37007.1 2-dehydropantoate 2-reductase [Vicinamibacterales bacterium]|tara:strand:+ start:453 stop:1400 length:948 start_codon:yes stop_codon:yes gene_type:complete
MADGTTRQFAILGSGAVGGYYGAKLARAGHRVTFLARGAHLAAMRATGLQVRSVLGDFAVPAEATDDPASVGPVDVVLFAVKTYDNDTALPMLSPLVGDDTVVLTLQNGVDSSDELAGVVGEGRVLGGATYIATALSAPGLIEQTGTHRKIVFGEAFGDRSRVSDRVSALGQLMEAADIEVETVADARRRLWEKLIYLCPFASFTGAARSPIGKLWSDPDTRQRFMAAVAEVEAVARAEGVDVSNEVTQDIRAYMDSLPAATRSSMLIDLSQGKRIEVEALQGVIVRRGAALGVATPIVGAHYAVLKPHAGGASA